MRTNHNDNVLKSFFLELLSLVAFQLGLNAQFKAHQYVPKFLLVKHQQENSEAQQSLERQQLTQVVGVRNYLSQLEGLRTLNRRPRPVLNIVDFLTKKLQITSLFLLLLFLIVDPKSLYSSPN